MLNIHYITVSYNYISHITIKNILKTSLLPQKSLKSRISAHAVVPSNTDIYELVPFVKGDNSPKFIICLRKNHLSNLHRILHLH